VLHDKCQWLHGGLSDIPAECQVGHVFQADGTGFKILEAHYPSADANSYVLAVQGAENSTFECSCFDHGDWLCNDPADFAHVLQCAAAPQKVVMASNPAVAAAEAVTDGPSAEQERGACCVLHDKCQWLHGGLSDIPAECQVGHVFQADGTGFKILEAHYPSTDANNYVLALEGAESKTFDCSCFDHGDWFCSDPTDFAHLLECKASQTVVV